MNEAWLSLAARAWPALIAALFWQSRGGLETARRCSNRPSLLILAGVTTFGVTCVVDADGRLAGSFSAGDLLRLHIRDRSLAILGRPVADFMTVNPRHIGPETLAAEALNLMEQHNIRALFVVNDTGEPIGIIGLYEVLKAIDY